MLKLLNRFAWLIAIGTGSAFGALFGYGFESYIIAIIAIFVIKLLFLSENFLIERLEFFADSIKKNYINKENIINNSPIIPFHKGDEDIIDNDIVIKEEIITFRRRRKSVNRGLQPFE
ncbi:MAG: hypothetical protein Q9M97_09320 [Candidatus Gracilibacteria bacterium]|nr:hypothetical protein [Candidatus Gracilibacteria bacterium]